MRRFLLPVLALCSAPVLAQATGAPVPSPKIHALFVGINDYAHSRAHEPEAGFENLRGAVGDVGRFKRVISAAYGWDLDPGSTSGCRSANQTSITLTDSCATREEILRALAAQINAAKPGETVLLYFAGHGTSESDGDSFDQTNGNSTFVPHDARDKGRTVREIYDIELKVFRANANRRGVNFVGVFDSCHSGTLVRGSKDGGMPIGTPRTIWSDNGLAKPPPSDPSLIEKTYGLRGPIDGVRQGYWVSLAAADDTEDAKEIDSIAEPAGVFTSSLVAAIRANPRATFGDLISDARSYIIGRGFMDQHPKAESAIHESFSGGAGKTSLYEAQQTPAGIMLDAGSLSGVTEGSRFALFASEADAQADTPVPLAIGTISQVDGFGSRLAIEPIDARLPDRIVAVEKQHNWGAQRIAVGLKGRLASGPANMRVRAMLGKLDFVTQQEPIQAYLISDDGVSASLYAVAATLIMQFKNISSPGFEPMLGEALRNSLRAKILFGLAQGQKGAGPLVCIKPDSFDANACQASREVVGKIEKVQFGNGAKFQVTVRSRAKVPQRLYVFFVSPDGQFINVVLPPPGTDNLPVAPNSLVQSEPFIFPTIGIWRFVAIASKDPINTAALAQNGVTARDPGACATAVNAALCAAGRGANDKDARSNADWSASVTEVNVDGSDG